MEKGNHPLAALWRRRTATASVVLALILAATPIVPSPTRAADDDFAKIGRAHV